VSKMDIKTLIGAGDKTMAFTLPFALAGIILNILYPQIFLLNYGLVSIITGIVFLALGIPFWLAAVVQMIQYVPKNRLITKGPFSILLHPIYTSVAILIIPGLGFIFSSWVGAAIGVILYIISRIFRVREEQKLNGIFGTEYQAYRLNVLIPWL